MNKQNIFWTITSAIAFFILTLAMGSWYTVDEGERGVVTRYGKVKTVADPGLHYKMPYMDSVTTLSVRDHVAIYDNMEAYSRDQQPAALKVSVSYRLLSDSVVEVYSTYGTRDNLVDRLITRKTLEITKTVFGGFNAEASIRERARLNAEISKGIQQAVGGPVVILGVQVEDVAFSNAYEKSVEERMLAEVAVQREHQNLEKEKIQANIVREQAQAAADAITMKGKAEADAITARGEALRNSSGAHLIELTKAERWDGKLPTTVLPDSSVPFFNAKPQ